MRITHATLLPPTSLRLRWADGYEALLDLSPSLLPDDPLRDPAIFAQGRLNGLTIEWPGGIDYCPDTLRLWCEPRHILHAPTGLTSRAGACTAPAGVL